MPNTAKKENTAYDAVQYTSFPFPQTNPASLQANAFLFGLDAPSPEKARILELGCASGNNILAMATHYPKSECVGIDFSEVQIAQGNKNIKALGIKNLKLEQKSILEIDASFGKFDYIICHGVFSWVPTLVQEKILAICSQNLSENGIAYVSYNTMPGWATVKAIRDMMLYHTARYTEPQQKAAQARLLLKFLEETHQNFGKSPYAEILSNEAKLLSGQSDWYLLHDHLEENN